MTSSISKRLFLTFAAFSMAYTASAMAGTCDVHSVKMFPGTSNSLRPHIEQALRNKGYQVIQDGYLDASYDVPVDQLKVRDDLLKPNSLLAIFSGPFANDDSTMCDKAYDGTIHCRFSFFFYLITETGQLAEISKIERSITEKPSFFNSESRIAQQFASDVVEAAKNQIPNCNDLKVPVEAQQTQ
jgi:hypothetical protein